MSILYIAGDAGNHILTTSSFSTSSSEDSNLPWSNLSNPQGWYAGRFNAAAANDFIHADLGSSKSATFCSVHFHNLDSGITVELRRGASGTTLVATMTKATPSFFATFGSASDQHWRLRFVGTNSSAIYVGKWVLGSHSTLTRSQDLGWDIDYSMENVRISGALPPKNMSKYARRALSLNFKPDVESDRDEVLTMLRDSSWGEQPLIIVPDSNDEIVLYGRASPEWGYKTNFSQWIHRVTVEEDPFPVIVN